MNNEKVNYQRAIEMLVICIFLTYLATNLFGFITIDTDLWLARVLECLIFYVMMLPSVICYKLQKGSFGELKKTSIKQCIFGVICGIVLSFVFSGISYVLGFGGIGYVTLDKISDHIYFGLHYIVFVAVAEEFIFRIYIQKTFEKLLGGYKILAPVFSAALFALYHLINCNWYTVVIAFILGLIWGYMRYFWKKCSFAYLVFAHGFYDYIIYLAGVILFKLL